MKKIIDKIINYIKKNKKNKNFISLTIIGFIAIIFVVFLIVYYFPMNENEKKVLEVVNNYKPMLKNPDSLDIHEIRCKETVNDDNKKVLNVYLDTSGQNGFGGMTRTITYYLVTSNNEVMYFGNDSKSDDSISYYTDYEEKIEIRLAKKIRSEWEELENNKDCKINIDKIIRRVK